MVKNGYCLSCRVLREEKRKWEWVYYKDKGRGKIGREDGVYCVGYS